MTTPTPTALTIDVWSDFVCPFCYIGHKRLQSVIDELGLAEKTTVVLRSFELDPNAREWDGTPIEELLARKYSMPVEHARQLNKRLGQDAAADGIHFDFAAMKHTNTLDAHRLAKWAAAQGKQDEFAHALFKGYFTDGLLIHDHDVLADLAGQAGLDAEQARLILADPQAFLLSVREDEQQARGLGISSVPTFIINGSLMLSGAQPRGVMAQALTQALESTGGNHPGATGDACGIDGSNC